MTIIDEAIDSEWHDVKVKGNHHYIYDNRAVPSVTTILSKCIHEDYLMNWANYLGFKRIKYKDRLQEAADMGTDGHNAIENYLRNKVESENICLQSFLLWWNMINESNTVEVVDMEHSMVLPYCGGTYDILLKINDRLFLVDLKTSNKLSYKYFIQLAAYRHMLYKLENINIDGCVILQLDKYTPYFVEQALDFTIESHYDFIEQCAFTFISLVLAYYNIYKTEADWGKLF